MVYRKKCGSAPARKLYRIGIWFTHKNGDFGAVSATERSWTTQILKVDRHLSVEFFSCEMIIRNNVQKA